MSQYYSMRLSYMQYNRYCRLWSTYFNSESELQWVKNFLAQTVGDDCTLGNRRRNYTPNALASGCGGDLTGCNGEKPRELNWCSLAGACALIYYYMMFVHICIGSTNDCSRIFWTLVAWGRSVHQAQPWNGNKAEHKATAWRWQNGSEGKKSIAMHCTEMNEVRSACGMMWKEKRSIETAWLAYVNLIR